MYRRVAPTRSWWDQGDPEARELDQVTRECGQRVLRRTRGVRYGAG